MGRYYDDDEALGTLELGAVRRGYVPPRRGMYAPPGFRPTPMVPRSGLVPNIPGVPNAGLRLQPLGLGVVTFTATSGLSLAATAAPQKPFKPQRLILDISRTGATATGLVTVTRIDIGADNMLVSSGGVGAIPAAMFANNGVDLNLQFAPATPGVVIAVQLALSAAPTMTDTVAVSAGMLGTAYGH